MLDIEIMVFWKPNKMLNFVTQLLHSDRGYFRQLGSSDPQIKDIHLFNPWGLHLFKGVEHVALAINFKLNDSALLDPQSCERVELRE